MNDHSFMSAMINPDRDDKHCRAPFSVRFSNEGQWFDGVTDGHGLLLLRSDAPSFRTDDDLRPAIVKFAGPEGDNLSTTDWPALDRWLDGVPGAREVTCTRCNGTPPTSKQCLICNGNGMHECDCGHEHECERCDGRGHLGGCDLCESSGQMLTKSQPGNIDGVVVNRVVVKRFLESVPRTGDCVRLRFGGRSDPVYFFGEGWICTIMPYLHEADGLTQLETYS